MAFVRNETVQKLLDNRNIELARIAPKELPDGAKWIGHIATLAMDIYAYEEWYVDDFTDPENKEEKSMIPEGKLMMASTNSRRSSCYAAITIAGDDDQFITVESERVPETWMERKPARRFVSLSSSPLTVPHEADSWLVATVL